MRALERAGPIGILVSACAFASVMNIGQAFAQVSHVTITDQLACARCTIERVLVSRITDSQFPGGAIGATPVVSVSEDTTFFVTSGPGMNELYFANRNGRVVERIGRSGAGPGEYRQPWYVVTGGDMLWVVDIGLVRATKLTKEDLQPAGVISLPTRPLSQPVILGEEQFVINGSLTDDAAAPRPVHVVSGSGEIIASLGSPVRPTERRNRLIAASGDTAVWVAQSNDYRLELWSAEGELLRVVKRESALFPGRVDGERIPASAPGNGEPRIKQVFEDERSQLWVMIGVPKRPSTAPPQRPGPDWDKSDSAIVVEVIDLRTQRLDARLRLNGIYPLSVTGRFLDFDYVSTPSGEPVLEVWGYRVEGVERR